MSGEAKEFRFFAPGDFQTKSEIGLQQDNVIYTLKDTIGSHHPTERPKKPTVDKVDPPL